MGRLFRKVLVPYDFSKPAAQALRAAADLAAGERGRLLVLHAIPPVYPVAVGPGAPAWIPTTVPTPTLLAEQRSHLEAAVRRAIGGRKTPRVECRVVVADPFQAIVDAARGATSIVMSTLGRTGLAHLLLGSVASKVVRHAPVPVLTLRPRVLRKRRR